MIKDKLKATSKIILDSQFDYLKTEFSKASELKHVLEYSLNESGILFRPYLCQLGIEQSNIEHNKFIDLLTAIEYIQKSTLVIDDIIDNSPLRNKIPSVHSKFGTKKAILCGEI